MGDKTSSAITARFTNEEALAINEICEKTGIARSVFIHDAVIKALDR